MSLTAHRTVRIIQYLRIHPEARFKDLQKELTPISRTALSTLLQLLVKEGELQHNGRIYSLSSSSAPVLVHGTYVLPCNLVDPVERLLGVGKWGQAANLSLDPGKNFSRLRSPFPRDYVASIMGRSHGVNPLFAIRLPMS